MLNVLSHCSRVLVNRLPPPPMPALLNRRWILSVACCSVISSRKRLSCSSMETSATCVVMCDGRREDLKIPGRLVVQKRNLSDVATSRIVSLMLAGQTDTRTAQNPPCRGDVGPAASVRPQHGRPVAAPQRSGQLHGRG